MSDSSYRLFRRPGSKKGWWLATVTVDGKKYSDRPLKTADKAVAEKRAAALMQRIAAARKLAAAQKGKKKTPAPPPAKKKPAAPAAAPPSSSPSPAPRATAKKKDPPRLLVREAAPEVAERLKAIGLMTDAPAAPPPAPAPEASEESSEETSEESSPAEKLKDVPIEPDGVEPPAAAAGDDGEAEAGDLFADTIALGISVGTVKIVSDQLAKRKPPRRAGLPHEKSMEWYREGLSFRLRALMGNAAMGPTAKMLVGCAGVVLSMVMGSEEMEPQAQQPAAASSRQEPEADHEPPPAPPPSREMVQHQQHGANGATVGRFR